MMNKNMSVLLSYAGKRRLLYYATLLLGAISAVLSLIPFYYIWDIIRELLSPTALSSEIIVKDGVMAVVFSVLTLVVYTSALVCSHLCAFRIAANMRKKALKHVFTLPIGIIRQFGTGKLRKSIHDSANATETIIAHITPDKAVAFATPVALLFFLLYFDYRLGLLSLLPAVLGFGITSFIMKIRIHQKDMMTQYQDSIDTMSAEAVEYVRGVAVVKTFGQSVHSFTKFKNAIEGYASWVLKYTIDLMPVMIIFMTANNAIFASLVGAALYFDDPSAEFLINLIFYIIITPVLSVSMTRILFSGHESYVVDDALSRYSKVLDLSPMVMKYDEVTLRNHDIDIENISFSYDGENKVFDNLSLTVKAGTTVALVGNSGGGKSTLANLLARSFDVNEGSIKIGGIDIRDLPPSQFHQLISCVFQDSRLLKMSIADNVRLAHPDASDDEVRQALEQARCNDIIEKFPERENTMIGSKGVFVSVGEEQRLCIARAMLKNSPILILDEATAYADSDNESKIQQALSRLAEDKTVIIIAHRLSTVVNADNIVVIDKGKIAENGSHQNLLEQNGVYADMWKNYKTAAQWKVGKRNYSENEGDV